MFRAVLAALSIVAPVSASGQEIWFDPWPRTADYSDLFRPDAPWRVAASNIRVFEIGSSTILGERPEYTVRIAQDLQRRGISIAVGVSPLSGRGDGCGVHVEGYSADGEPRSIAQKAKQLGITPSLIVLDEPLSYGHKFVSEGNKFGCRYSIRELADNVATKVRQIRDVFPGIPVGDVEPFRGDKAWLDDTKAWLEAFRDATGGDLAFLRLDMAWDRSWQSGIPQLIKLLNDSGVPLQVIYNGDDKVESDAAWTATAVSHFQAFERIARPSAAVFQYWSKHPSRVLPETDLDSATGLVNRYLHWRQSQ